MAFFSGKAKGFPKAKLFDDGFIKVSDQHTLYYQQYGKKRGAPVIFLHGGPGGGATIDDTVFFDPKHYRIILLDQRGAGKSTPPACVENNTTQDLINDINKLRDHLKIKGKAHIFGGSWGSTLSLAYTIAHPDKVLSLTLRGIFLTRRRDIDIFYQGNAAHPSQPQSSPAAIAFSKAWRDYVAFIPPAERHDMLQAYHDRIHGDDEALRQEAAKQWATWEGAASKLVYDDTFIDSYQEDGFALRFASIETHYFVNCAFLGDDDHTYFADNIHKIAEAGIPTEIVHGRYDLVCPRYQADELVAAWPADASVQPVLHIVTAGHNAHEPEIEKTLIDIMERRKKMR